MARPRSASTLTWSNSSASPTGQHQ
jgi:hypothetical protein